jgi:DNA topoisomerase I
MSSKKIPFDEQNYESGILRKKNSDKYDYYYIKNNKKVPKDEYERIKKLSIPPAWEDVWISSDSCSAIQATGIDSKGRKQYRYNELHIQKAEREKFVRLYDFIKAIPKLEETIKKHRKCRPYDKNRVITTMLKIVKELYIRVGKECYAKENKSYGISSLRKKHIKIKKGIIYFKFRAKSKKIVSYTLRNKRILEHLEVLLLLDGDRLFQYVDEENRTKYVTDMDLNRYIQAHMGDKFVTKDFRTYAANYHFVKTILQETQKRIPKNAKIIKKNIKTAISNTAYYLRHTKAISKKSYVMNFCMDKYSNDTEYFITNKFEDPNIVLMDLLKKYKREHIE